MAAWQFLLDCCCFGLSGEELYRDWDNHPAVQQYSFIKRLGEGGFSEVQLAQDKLTGKRVALKIIFLNKAGLTSEQKKILAGEAKLIRMVAHPNIIRCMQVLETRRQQVLVLEHLSGGEMLQQLLRVRRYTEAHACQLFRQIADAVAYMHGLSIMHRDIKPENCLLAKPASFYAAESKPCKVKLIDLGMAGLYRPHKPLYGCMGSPGFIAPEVVLGDAHTPALDIYSLGVLLFVMLVGRKPWDAQRSHTLQYAIQATAEAPGLTDPVFLALSQPARELLLWMLHEQPSCRPTAAQVLGHKWMLQAAQGPNAGTSASSERLIQPAVQQRLRILGNSRQVMGTARGMLLLHSRGSRSGAVAFHRAVREARLKLQQQAAALEASGHLQQLQQLVPAAAGQLAPAAEAGSTSFASTAAAAVAPACTSAAASAAQTLQRHVEAGSQAAGPAATSSGTTAAGGTGSKPFDGLSEKPTVGQLARQSLVRKSMLFDGRRPPLPSVNSASAAASGTASADVAPGTAAAAGGSTAASQAHDMCGAKAAASCNPPVGVTSPDHSLGCKALERGMSLPNPDFTPLTTSGYLPCPGRYRAGRAVSVSPSALALLDADDRLCLLAAGASADDGSDALFSWGARQGAADMVASFRQQYPMKPILKSIARFGCSLSSSLSKSFRPGTLHSHSGRHSGRYLAAAAATEELGLASAGAQECPGSATAGAAAVDFTRMLSISSDGDSSDMDSLLARHAVDSSSQLLADSSSCPHSAHASRANSTGIGCRSPRLPSRFSVGVSGLPAAAGAIESSSRGTAVGCNGVFQPSSAAAAHRGKPPLPAAVKQQLTAPGRAASLGLTCPAGWSMQTSGSGGDHALQRSASATNGTDGSFLAGAHSAEHSVELVFLGTQFSMSPPVLSPQTSAPGALATVQSQGEADNGVQDTVLVRADSHGSNSSSSNRRRKQSQQQQLMQQQGVFQWQGHAILAQPHLLPAIPSETSLSASASSAASQESFAAVAADPGTIICPTRNNGSQRRSHGAGQAGNHKQQPQQHPNQVTPFSNASASTAAVGVVVLADAVSPVPQLHKAPSRARRSRECGSSTGAAANASRSVPPASAAHQIKSVMKSPNMRAAATAAAAREEEEGLDLPNGLWLQQSQSLDSSIALSPGEAMLPAFSASSALQSPLVGRDGNSLADVVFELQQAVEGHNEAAEGGLVANVVGAGSSMLQGSSRNCKRDTADSPAAAAAVEGDQKTTAAVEARAAGRHQRDPSMLDWMVNTDELQHAPGGGRDPSVMHWLPRPVEATTTTNGVGQQGQQQQADIFASLAWLNSTSSDEQGRDMTVLPGIESCSAATVMSASVVPRTRPCGSSTGGGHAIPLRTATHRVAVPYHRQSSVNRQKRRTLSYSRRLNGRRSGSMNASGGGVCLALADGTGGEEVLSAVVGPGLGLGDADAADNTGGLGALGAEASTEQHDALEAGVSHASGELADFYVGSFTDRQGLAAAGEQLGHSTRFDSIEEPAAAALAVLATATDEEGRDELHRQASAADGDDGLLLGSVDLTHGENLCTCRISVDGTSGGKATAAAAAEAQGGMVNAGSSAAGTVAGSLRSSDTTDSRRSSTSSSSKRPKHAAAIGQSKAAAAAAATVALYLEKQQYHQQQYSKRLQQYSSATAVSSRCSTGGPATVAMTGGAWYFDAKEHSSRSGSSSSSDCSSPPEAAAAFIPPHVSAGVVPGVAATQSAVAAVVVPSSASPAFDAVRHAGGVAWLVRGLSGKCHMPDADVAPPAAAGVGLAGSRLKGSASQQHQQPTFDDFDELSAYYYAS